MKHAVAGSVIAAASVVVSVEREQWAAIYEQARPNLVRALAACAGSYEGVEDAIQEAVAVALEHPPTAIRSPEAWLFTVALNKLRSQRRRARLAARLRLAAPRVHEYDDVLVRADIVALLERLSERERTLLIAKYYIGMTQDEIAQQLRIPRGTVAAAISRAAAHFREMEKQSD